MGFLLEAARSLPTKTEEEVRDHEKWYREYLRLNDLKKEAIHKWKEQKEVSSIGVTLRCTVRPIITTMRNIKKK